MHNASEWRLAEITNGSPPRTKHTGDGELMKPGRHLLLASYPDGPMLFRYADDWDFAGDTWHEDVDAALGQIEYEFGSRELEWKSISETSRLRLWPTRGKRKAEDQ